MKKENKKRINVKVRCDLTVPFYSFGSKKKDRKAAHHIQKWVRSAIKRELPFVPLYVEKDDTGAWIEDCSQEVKVKLK